MIPPAPPVPASAWADSDAAAVFSPRAIRTRLVAGEGGVNAYRDTLAWGHERLNGMFHEGQPAQILVQARAYLVDAVLASAWARFFATPPTAPGASAEAALLAVGGYGRGELLPHSDIDILILHTPEALEALRPSIEGFLTFLWDIRLDVGASTRTIAECVEAAREDITVMTTMMESRWLAGATHFRADLDLALAPPALWPVDSFFRAKQEEQIRRYKKHGDATYRLEPNVKEGPGGLRDIHTVMWIARRMFGATSLADLRAQGFLTKPEVEQLYAGLDYLWRVRFALHMVTKRHEDRLLFDHQLTLAKLFGYVDQGQNQNRAVEQFMQVYYRTIKSLSCLNDILLQEFEERLFRPDGPDTRVVLNERFYVRNGYLEIADIDVFKHDPVALVELFALWQLHPDVEVATAFTLRQLLIDRRLLDDHVRRDVRARALFIGMFRHGTGLTLALRRMNRYGILGQYLPIFGRVVGLMQYDLFHTLTVDEHTLYVLRNMRRLATPRFAHELPFGSDLFREIPHPEVLYIACLFHDIAKGRGGDHSALGATEAETFCLDHGLSHADTALVVWLVQHHLLMSLTAQRQDISDPEAIAVFAAKVGTQKRLDHLYLLTVADIRGTNPALWNSWRDSLLKDLYRATRRAFARGLDNPESDAERVAEQQARALGIGAAKGITEPMARAVWSRFEPDYFLRHGADELAWHLTAMLKAPRDEDLPLILIEFFYNRGTTIFLYTRDRAHLFGLTTGVLASLGLSVLDARLNTTADGYTLDTYVLTEPDGKPVQGRMRFAEIGERLRRVVADPMVSAVKVSRRPSTRLKHFDTPVYVGFHDEPAQRRTVLEVTAADQPGLLSLIGGVFHEQGVLLEAAKIGTIGERAEDVFYVTGRDHAPLTREARERLRVALLAAIDASITPPTAGGRAPSAMMFARGSSLPKAAA